MTDGAVAAHGVLSVGTVFHGRYEIVRLINQGGMGAVYECVHLKTRKHRALKVMLPQVIAQASLRDRFELEARVTADIDSEHIAETFDAGVDEASGSPFLVMELLRGEDLERFVARRGPLTGEETVLLLSQAALALDRTHAAGIVHRDLKPQNLFLTTRDDGSPRLKVLDFGIAKVVHDSGTTSKNTATIGTPAYMPPEQIRGVGWIGPAADVYALAHIAYALLTGEAYWEPEIQGSASIFVFWTTVMAGVMEPASARARVRRRVALPPAFDGWFARAVAMDPQQRPESASKLVAELGTVFGLTAVDAPSRVSVALVPKVPQAAPRLPTPVPSDPPRGASPAPAAQPTPPPPPEPPPAPPAEKPGIGRTTSPVVGDVSRNVEPARRRSAGGLYVLAASGILGVAVLVVLAPRFMDRGATAGTPTQVAAALPLTPIATASVVSTSTAAISAPSAARAPQTAEPAPSAPPPPHGRLVVHSTATAVAAAPSAAPTVPPPPVKNCNPPTYVDGAGHTQFKPECL
jgi:serine/threonine-protein kinase